MSNTKTRRRKRGTSYELSWLQKYELAMGPRRDGSWRYFDSDVEAERAYWANRGTLLAWGHQPGRRPWAWWAWEYGQVPDYQERPVILAREGYLTGREAAEVRKLASEVPNLERGMAQAAQVLAGGA